MNYEEAHEYMSKELHGGEWGAAMLAILARDNVMDGLLIIKKLTLCDDNTAKLIWVDLKCENSERIKELQNLGFNKPVNSCVPKCPTCGSTNIKKLFFSGGWNPKQFRCNNCRYEW